MTGSQKKKMVQRGGKRKRGGEGKEGGKPEESMRSTDVVAEKKEEKDVGLPNKNEMWVEKSGKEGGIRIG